MKAEGVVRSIDGAGRIVLPRDIRERMELNGPSAAVEIFTEGDKIIFRKYSPSCNFCNNAGELVSFKGVNICRTCLEAMKKL